MHHTMPGFHGFGTKRGFFFLVTYTMITFDEGGKRIVGSKNGRDWDGFVVGSMGGGYDGLVLWGGKGGEREREEGGDPGWERIYHEEGRRILYVYPLQHTYIYTQLWRRWGYAFTDPFGLRRSRRDRRTPCDRAESNRRGSGRRRRGT